MTTSGVDLVGEARVDDEQIEPRRDLPPRDGLRVMQMLADGYSDPQIARILGISLVTVRRRAQRFCRSLGAKSRLQAMAEAVARGWVTPRVEEEDEPDGEG